MLLPRRLAGFAGLVTVVALGAPAFPARAQESPVVRQLSPVLSLTPQDPSSAGGFGASLAFDGQHLVVGTPRSHLDPWRQASGSVHFLSFHEGTFDWDWEYAIPTGAINEVLGGRVTLSGPFATAATASSGPSSGTNQGGSAPGSIRLYGHDGDGWHLSGSIVPRFPDEPNGFGDAVILGSGLAVAAPGTASGVREVSGAVLVYDRPFTGPPSAPHRIESPFPGRFTGFAGDLAAPDEDTLIVAAAGATVDGEAARGAVFVYRRTQTGWVEHQQIIDPGGRSHFYFGGSIAAFGNTLLVSSSVPSGPTRIHVLERDGDRWVSRGELEQPTGGILLPAMTLDGGWAA
ncbi:MAG TPA: hypothetical protein ENK19_09295, partial [Acidobacteria bacterium]|nr:hypothetical protein [Acidobacteriota bacterium]